MKRQKGQSNPFVFKEMFSHHEGNERLLYRESVCFGNRETKASGCGSVEIQSTMVRVNWH